MKRYLSIVLLLAMLITTLVPLEGCSVNPENVITMGQWLSIVDEAFGMQDYYTTEPFFENITEENPYFSAVQIAADWEVIDVDKSIDVNRALTWKEALVTLVNVGNFTDLDETEDNKISCAIKTFDPSIRKYWKNRVIDPARAIALLSTAQNLWANKTYDHIIEEAVYKAGVIDFTQGENKISEYSIEDGITIIPKSQASAVNAGDIYVLPSTEKNRGVTTYKAESISEDDQFVYIKNSKDELELEDIAQDLFIEETFIPMAENAVVYDANGNVISVGSNVMLQNNWQGIEYDTGTVSNLLAVGTSNSDIKQMYDLQDPKVNHKFTVGDWEIGLEYKLNGALDLKFSVKTPNMLTANYRKEHPSQELKASFGAELSKLKITNDIDYKMFKLRSASVRVDYEQKFSGGITFAGKPKDKLFAPEYRNTGGFLTNWKNRVWKDAKGDGAKGAKTIKICSVDLYTVGVARLCLDVNFAISAEGSATVSLTLRGAKGIEYRNGKLRLINTCDKDWDFDIKAKIEGTLGVGPALYTVGLKKPIIGFEVKGGAGAALNVKFNLADSDNHLLEVADGEGFNPEFTELMQNSEIYSDVLQIKEIAESQGCTYDVLTSGKVKCHCDTCIDGSVYGIVRVAMTDTSYIASLLGGKITTSWEIFGEKNCKLLNIHADNFNFKFSALGQPIKCTLQYLPFDNKDMDEDISQDSITDNETILEGDAILLTEMYTSMVLDSDYYIQIAQLPKGYTTADIVCSSKDESIVKVNKDGVVTATGSGATVIIVSTSDKKYSTWIAITVIDPSQQDFTPLDIDISKRRVEII